MGRRFRFPSFRLPRYNPPPRRYNPPPRPPPPPPKPPVPNCNNLIIPLKTEISKLNTDLNSKKAEITRLNYKINDISNTNQFLKDKMYGSKKQPGFLNILTKKSQSEHFSNINNREGMNLIEGIDATQTDSNNVINENKLLNVINENKLLESQIQQNQNNYTTDDTQVFYKTQQYYRQQNLNFILFIIFYSLILGLAVYLFIFNNTINVYLKIFITILLAIYPFIIESIEFFVYFIFYYVYALINGVPFDLGNYYGFTFK